MNPILNQITCNPVIESNKYKYNDNPVPRVTEILSSMLHEESLMGWSNYLGFNNKKYKDVLDKAARIGTYVHNNIEYYLKNNKIKDNIPIEYKYEIENALYSFISWYDTVKSNNDVKILGIEDELICKWFGGTADLLIKINDMIYLIDFKTSNYITYKHFLQLSAYKYMYNLNNINIDGVIILQLDKNNIHYNEYILFINNIEHKIFLENCLNTFLGLVYSYYNRLNVQQQFNEIFNK